VKSETRNVKTVRCRIRARIRVTKTKALGVGMLHRKQQPTAVM